jgi:hypothetical protein
MITAERFSMPTMPAGSGNGLRRASAEYAAALVPCGAERAEHLLTALRRSTIITNEAPMEAKATMSMLVAQLADMPADLLSTACDRFTRHPGRRFFPKASGELIAFVSKDWEYRKLAAVRFAQMASQADEEDAERKRLAEPMEWTPEAIRDLGQFAATGVRQGWFTQAQLDEATA